jgi:hypothetical protein
MSLFAPLALMSFAVVFLSGCGQHASTRDQKDWVAVASLGQHEAYTLQFQLYHASIPHRFEGSYTLFVPPARRADAIGLLATYTNQSVTILPNEH